MDFNTDVALFAFCIELCNYVGFAVFFCLPLLVSVLFPFDRNSFLRFRPCLLPQVVSAVVCGNFSSVFEFGY